MRTAPGAGLFKAYRRLRAGGSSLLPIEDCLLQLPFAGVSCFLRFLLARLPVRLPSSALHCALVGRSTRAIPPPFPSPRPPHRSPPICNPLVRRHAVASHGPARLFHYHATPIISFALSCLHSTLPPAHPPPCCPTTRPSYYTRDIRTPWDRCLRSCPRFLVRPAAPVSSAAHHTSTLTTFPSAWHATSLQRNHPNTTVLLALCSFILRQNRSVFPPSRLH
jgi:hypothetical protein